MAGGEQQTGTQDEHYNLISALYHLLKGASTSEQYVADAQEAGDQELAQFFRDWQDEQRNFAERAKNLLGSRMLQPSAGIGGVQERKQRLEQQEEQATDEGRHQRQREVRRQRDRTTAWTSSPRSPSPRAIHRARTSR